MRDRVKQAIIEHAKREYPRESCGLVLDVDGAEHYFPCRNIAENTGEFIMDPKDQAFAEDVGNIIAVVHSHCNIAPTPSQADLVMCENWRLPWHIVSIPNETWATIFPCGFKAPLVGRQFFHGVLDCYSLIKDWYERERNMTLPHFERSEEWWTKGDNLYLENFASAGFEPVDTLEPGDIIIMQIGAKVPNHAAVYLGNNVMLHHLQKRISTRDVYGGFWQKNTRLVVRFKGSK